MERKSNNINYFIIWVLVTLFYCYQYVLRLLPNVIMPELMRQFSIGANEFGDFAGIYYIGYIVMQIPIGILLSRFGAKKILPISILIAAFGILPMGMKTSWELVIFGRLLIGVGSSAAIVGAFQIFREIFPNRFSQMIGSFVCVGLLTAIYISKPLGNVSQNIGFEEMVYIIFITGIVLSVFTFIALPRSKVTRSSNIISEITDILVNYKLIIMSILAGLMVAPLEGFADAWGTAFVRMVYDLDRQASDSIIGTILKGMCVGSIIVPYIADKTRKYYLVTIVSGVIMAICFGFMLTGYPSKMALYLLCLIIGICCAYQIVIISHISTFVKLPLSGMASAVSNMIIMAFGFVFHKAIAAVIDSTPGKIIVDNVPIYSYNAYIYGVAIIPIAIIIAIVGFSFAIILKKA